MVKCFHSKSGLPDQTDKLADRGIDICDLVGQFGTNKD